MNISLELAKELAAVAEEKGYKLPDFEGKHEERRILDEKTQMPYYVIWKAPSASELLEALPIYINKDERFWRMDFKKWRELKDGNVYSATYVESGRSIDLPCQALYPQDALCKLYIYLIKNDLI